MRSSPAGRPWERTVIKSCTEIAGEEEEEGREEEGEDEDDDEVEVVEEEEANPRSKPPPPPPPPFLLLISSSSSSLGYLPFLLPNVPPSLSPSLIKCSVFSTAITTGTHSSSNFNVSRIRRHTKHTPISLPPSSSLPSSSSPPPSIVKNAVKIDEAISFSICPWFMPLDASRGWRKRKRRRARTVSFWRRRRR